MLKKYLLLGLILLIPLFLINLDSTLDIGFRARVTYDPSNLTPEDLNKIQASGIVYDSQSRAQSYLIFFVILLNLIIFLELRNDKLGGFISSLPIKNEKLYFYISFSGFLFVLTSFIMNLGFSYYSILREKNFFIATINPAVISDFENRLNLHIISFFKDQCLIYLSIFAFFCVLTFIQTLFKKPIFAVCAAVGGIFSPMLWFEIVGTFMEALDLTISYDIYNVTGNLYMGLLGKRNRGNFNHYFFIAILLIVIVVTYLLGRHLYNKTGRFWDSIFVFKTVKTIMVTGISISTGCLFVFIYNSIYHGLQLSVMSITVLLLLGLFIGFILPRKIFNALA